MPTDLLFLRDAYLTDFEAAVQEVDADRRRVALDRTAFYATGGGQPHDGGTLAGHPVVDVGKEGDVVWHALGGDAPLSGVGDCVRGEIDWARRHALMRTHTALHVLCGVIWNTYGKAVTGGNMEPLSARMDFEFDPLPPDFGPTIEGRVNEELAAARAIEVTFLPRDVALADPDLIRTKVNLIPESVPEIRIVDIVGLDKQADGGTPRPDETTVRLRCCSPRSAGVSDCRSRTVVSQGRGHVRTTAEVGRIRVVKTESKGKGNKRIRLEVLDA